MNTKSKSTSSKSTSKAGGPVAEYRYRSRALDVISRTLSAGSRPSVLELGPARSSTVDFFGQFSGSLFVADIREVLLAHLATDENSPGGSNLAAASTSSNELGFLARSLRQQHCLEALPSTGVFDLLLCWDLFNYLDQPALDALLPALSALCQPGTLLYVLLSDRPTTLPGPMQCSVVGSEEILLVGENCRVEMPCLCRESSIRKHFPGAELESAVRLRNGICELLFVLGQQEKPPKRPSKKFERP